VRVAIETGNTAGIDQQMVVDNDIWEDITEESSMPGWDSQVNHSHEGGDYFQFLDMAQDSLSW
jgi:hypothetical protein